MMKPIFYASLMIVGLCDAKLFLVNTYYASPTCDTNSVVNSVVFMMDNCISTGSSSSYQYTCASLPGDQTLQQTHYYSNSACSGEATSVANVTDTALCDGAASTWVCSSNPEQLNWPSVGFWEQETIPNLGYETCVPSEGPDTIFAYPTTCQTGNQGTSYKAICSQNVLSVYTYNGNTCSSQRSIEVFPTNACYRYDNGTNAYATCTLSELPGIYVAPSSGPSTLSVGTIAGIVCGVVAFVAILVFFWYTYGRSNKKTEEKAEPTPPPPAPAPAPTTTSNPMRSRDEEYGHEIQSLDEISSDYGSDLSTSGQRKTALLDKTEVEKKRRGRHEQIALFAFTKEVKERSLEIFGLPNPTTPLLWEQLRACAGGPQAPPIDGIFRVNGKDKKRRGSVQGNNDDDDEASSVRMVFATIEDCEDAKFRIENQLLAEGFDCKCDEITVVIMRPTQPDTYSS